jgi:hypothetical protein
MAAVLRPGASFPKSAFENKTERGWGGERGERKENEGRKRKEEGRNGSSKQPSIMVLHEEQDRFIFASPPPCAQVQQGAHKNLSKARRWSILPIPNQILTSQPRYLPLVSVGSTLSQWVGSYMF